MDLSLLISNLKDFSTFATNVEGFAEFSGFLVKLFSYDFGAGVDESGEALNTFSS
ncbi:hypothetical protein [Corynebacterium glutamicum]|uniref:hypothetical protein n=1 Tax=Corynebacterium glutamicum TaxID=1718 RepID=UPI000A69155F|nr:hypothetical protein [Corynebacterium glutamicum]